MRGDLATPADCAPIDVTPQMVEAGVSVLDASGRLAEGPMSGDGLLAEQVFRAMMERHRSARTALPTRDRAASPLAHKRARPNG